MRRLGERDDAEALPRVLHKHFLLGVTYNRQTGVP
jgi:hypothetical protein